MLASRPEKRCDSVPFGTFLGAPKWPGLSWGGPAGGIPAFAACRRGLGTDLATLRRPQGDPRSGGFWRARYGEDREGRTTPRGTTSARRAARSTVITSRLTSRASQSRQSMFALRTLIPQRRRASQRRTPP